MYVHTLVHWALSYTDACWMYGSLRAAEKSPLFKSYFLLIFFNTFKVILGDDLCR